MHVILKAENWSTCLVYLDDVLIYGKNFSEHLERLEGVLKRIKDAGLKLSPQKCSFLQTSLKFLGHIVSETGISPDEEKIAKVKNWPKPENIEELRSFLGFANYYRRFIKGYAEFTAPLEKMMKQSSNENINLQRKKPLLWCAESEQKFKELKDKLTSPPILSYPTRYGKFILDTDASHEGMGAVLSQIQEGKEKVIEYASKKFSKAELQYCVTRKELLSVYTFVLEFKHYLLGRPFLIRTDHKALTWILNWDNPNTSQYCKWIAELEQFDFIIEHRPGRFHANADFLSREINCQQCEIRHPNPLRKRNTKIIKMISSGDYDKDKVISLFHSELGHIGETKLIEIMKDNGFSWYKMNNDIMKHVATCQECAERKQGKVIKTSKMHIEASYPFEKIMLDITGPLNPRSKYGHQYILGIVDVFSRMPMLVPLRNTDSRSIINEIFRKWISTFGFPKYIITDNAPNLTSREWKSFCNKYDISKATCSPYYPQGNGIVERLFRTVKDRLFATTREKKLDWIDAIPHIELGLRSTKNMKTGFSPNEIVFGTAMKFPWKTSQLQSFAGSTYEDYMDHQNKRIENIHKAIRDRNMKVTVENKYEIGDLVMIKSVISNGWLRPKFIGPCRIIQIIHPKVYKLEHKGKYFIRNEFHLKPCSRVRNSDSGKKNSLCNTAISNTMSNE